jgi:hypothetical protein
MTTYLVAVRFLYPAWNEREGFMLEVVANSKTQAHRFALRQIRDDGHSGRLFLTAVPVPEPATP